MWRSFSKEAGVEIIKEAVKYGLLCIVPSGVALMGWLQEVPWFYVTVGTIISGAAIMTWIVQFGEWRSRNRVEHRLIFESMRIHLAQANNRIGTVQFGFLMQNTADFPIVFQIKNMETKLTLHGSNQSVYPPKRPYRKSSVTIPPGGTGWFDDHAITLPDSFQGGAIAEMKSTISYGKAGRFDYQIVLNKTTPLHFSGPEMKGGQYWYDQ